MSDQQIPSYAPEHRPTRPWQRRVGEAVWRLRARDHGRVRTRERLPSVGAGFEALVQDGEPLFLAFAGAT
jgi:hypothetical protein